jgi:DNA-binding transcriptional LysR family regulator
VAGVFYGTVRIGFSGALNHRTLPPLTRAVRQRYPEVTLEMVGRVMTRDGVAQIERGALDLAFVALPVDPSPLVRTRLVSREPLGVALPVDHPLADAPDVDLADLADDGFITTPAAAGSGLQEAALRSCVDAGFRPRVVQEITDPYMILTLVAAGLGVALMSAEVAAIMPSGTVYRPLRGTPTYLSSAIAWSADNPSAVLKAVLAVADEVLPPVE